MTTPPPDPAQRKIAALEAEALPLRRRRAALFSFWVMAIMTAWLWGGLFSGVTKWVPCFVVVAPVPVVIYLSYEIDQLRRRIWYLRAQVCPQCRYHLRGLPFGTPCPECGGINTDAMGMRAGPTEGKER